uniref:Reverse transcriptase domain-containing protein n=1 Tax=Denticeps clupeoides TaxID=299321 RepID=A0AAY4AXS2_9TELE
MNRLTLAAFLKPFHKTNNTQSEYFPLYRSTRQGCPLSPLLFALAVEPLSIALRSNTQITGIVRNGREVRVSLYISGYKLNLNKSELFPISTAARNYPLYSLPFKIAHHNFTYLGVCVTSKFEDLLKANFVSLLSKVREDCEWWSILNLSLTARVNTVKMNILPRFSYLFQCIPIFLPQSFFQKVDSVISEFIWNKKVPRLRKQYLQRPRKLGGLALPHFRFYYWASNIRILKYWLQSKPSDAQINWLAIEANSPLLCKNNIKDKLGMGC